MEIFEVRLSAASEDKLSELTRCLGESFADLRIDGRLETVPALGLIVYRCDGAAPDERERLAIHTRAAEGMAEYVLTSVEPELIRIMIRKYYPCGDEDVERIAELCMRMLGGRPERKDGPADASGPLAQAGPERECPDRDKATRRKRHIAAELLAYLQERPSLHLEGYITFRLDKYWEELAEAAEAAVDEFVMDRQYREFVGLLSEFVGRQQPRTAAVNLVLKADGGFALYDEAFRPIDPAGGRLAAEFAEFAEEELNVEDMVVSCLLAISPREIKLHARDPELPVVRTIGAIFAGRVTVCAGCGSCLPLTGAVLN
jgi:hypothetical protein